MEFEVPQDYDQNKVSSPAAQQALDKDLQPAEVEPQPQEELPQQPPLEEDQPKIVELPVENPKPPRRSQELKNLDLDLDGPSWTCKEEHGRRLRVRTTGIHESWDNVIHIQDEEETRTTEGILEQRD